ncbi:MULTISPECIES: hypothetical protein [unclassified Polynucleobacter]|uniref:MORN repeat-containing protein n=1 Tax=unclassified Polynucleobacter TaxID=2640945 RepID=UPI0024912083|nr:MULTISPECIES: hypothetical protein [unclassified Polynucleobacter]
MFIKSFLIFFSLFISCISYAQSNLPPCSGDYWNNCFEVRESRFGSVYSGEFKDNKQNGQGTEVFNNGNKYVGQFKDEKFNGQGTFTYADGRKYVGEWFETSFQGQGTFTYADGRKYDGQWKGSRYDGFGTLHNADGSIKQQGLWRDDKFVQAQTPPAVPPPVVPKPSVNNAQDIKRQKCIRLGLVPGSADFQQCIN